MHRNFIRNLLFTLLIVIAGALTGLAQNRFTEIDLTVNGIRSGSPYGHVKKFGKPIKVKILGFDECAGKYRRVIYFDGLEVGLLGSKDGKHSSVMSLTVTSTKWTIVPGVKIGATRAALIVKFGQPVNASKTRIDYVTKENLGLVTFLLRNGRLFRVEMMETLC